MKNLQIIWRFFCFFSIFPYHLNFRIRHHAPMLPFLQENVDLKNFSSFHTPARVRYFFELRERSDIPKLHEIFQFSKKNNLPIVFLGGGTNILFAFEVFEGIIVRNMIRGIIFDTNTVIVASGELVSPLSLQIAKKMDFISTQNLSKIDEFNWKMSTANKSYDDSTTNVERNFESEIGLFQRSLFNKWIWLPGTMGGAIAGNAGCFGFEVKDTLISATVFDLETGEYRTLSNTKLDFSYRHSLLKKQPNWFLVEAVLKTNLFSDDTTDPRTFRSSKQPGGFTCGSFFRNPPGDSAGRLIDFSGLKGHRIGGVKISEVHANFFVNGENGSYTDILALRDLAKRKVYEQFWVELQEEVRIIE